MSVKKVNEIFYSLQGEGFHAGTPAVFVRFSGCNLKCEFCDTDHESGIFMTDDEIMKYVDRYPAQMVVLTGGEPSLWVDCALVERLHLAGKFVCVETNGTHVLPEGIDWVTCSPKQSTLLALKHMDEVKVVYQGQRLDEYESLQAKYYFLQPCSGVNIPETIACVLEHPRWRLSLQLHKLINIK